METNKSFKSIFLATANLSARRKIAGMFRRVLQQIESRAAVCPVEASEATDRLHKRALMKTDGS